MKRIGFVLLAVGFLLVLAPFAPRTTALAQTTALLVQDNPPWCSSTADQTALTADGVSYTVVSSSAFLSMNVGQLLRYHEIIFAGNQYNSFYTALGNKPVVRNEIMVLLSAGVNIVIHAIDQGGCEDGLWTGNYVFPYPAFVQHVVYFDGTNHIVGSSVVLTGVTSPITGNFASHDYFTNVPAGANVLIENSINKPTYFTWTLGRGTLYASTMTLEF
ncbi:MAG TPA: hypothetical protein VKF39_01490, partial [Nitrososphaerales archaeon]|nr:hypothetical protein [Nitrososphaerales archaeon]